MYNSSKIKTLFKLRERATLPLDYFVFDTETVKTHKRNKNLKKYHLHGSPDSFYFGVVYGHNYTKLIYTVKDFIEEFEHPRYKNKKVFAHNLEYDLMVIYDNIYDVDPKAIFNGKLICATNGNCLFADSTNIFGKISVKNLGKMMQLEKLTLNDNDFDSYFNDEKGIPLKDITYCIRDCEIIFDALFTMFEFTGQICITQASLSLKYFCRHHLPYNIAHRPAHTKYFFNSYYGGRTEALKIGKTNAVAYDINSEYPYIMQKEKFPNPLSLKHEVIKEPSKEVNIKRLKNILKKYEGTAHIKVNHFDHWIGFLPFRKDGKLIFPIGEFSGWYNFPEIRYALEKDAIEILEVSEIIFGNAIDSPFKSFVNTLYSKRFETTNAFEIYRIKIFMNSLYGKLAQRIQEETIYLNNILGNNEQELIEKHQKEKTFIKIQQFNDTRQDGFLFVKAVGKGSLPYSIPSFSSYITTYGRLMLLDKALKHKENKPIYCDTDSLFFEIPLEEKISISTSNIPVLGAWKLEEKVITEVLGLKNYKYIVWDKEGKEVKKRKLKGVPYSAIEIRKNVFQYFNLLKTREALRRNLPSGVRIKRTKEISNKYDKRIVLNEGETKPIKL